MEEYMNMCYYYHDHSIQHDYHNIVLIVGHGGVQVHLRAWSHGVDSPQQQSHHAEHQGFKSNDQNKKKTHIEVNPS